jgi:hypothetical protein
LAAGASSLKIQLAFNKGHYGRALTDYNSVFSNYDNRILDRADKMNSRLDKLHKLCPSSEKIHAIQRISCEMSLSQSECESATRKLENPSIIISI